MTRALILGVMGQDGSYLAEHLASQGVKVFGVMHREDHPRKQLLLKRVPDIKLFWADVLDPTDMSSLIRAVKPNEVYNLAAVTSPGARWASQTPPLMLETTGVAVVRLLDLLKANAPDARFVHASSSAIYEPQRYGAYGAAKKLAHDAVNGYREHAGLQASSAVFYSHTSPRQQEHFLIRRLVHSVVQIAYDEEPSLQVTNLANRRDWGWSPDFARALAAVVQAPPGNYVVRTGVSHSVRDVLTTAARFLGLANSTVLSQWPNAARLPDTSEASHPMDHFYPPGWRHETTFAEMIKKLIEFEVSRREA